MTSTQLWQALERVNGVTNRLTARMNATINESSKRRQPHAGTPAHVILDQSLTISERANLLFWRILRRYEAARLAEGKSL